MSNEVTELLTALRDGTMSIDEVAGRFRERSWPRGDDSGSTSYIELASEAQQDPEPYIPGSYDDVAAAFHRGDLSLDQFDLLSDAIVESMRAEDQRDAGPGGSGS
jgi:hypothetical protein